MAKRDRVPPAEKSVRETREHLADVLYDAAAGRTTFITSRGRRIAAVVPLSTAEDALESEDRPQHDAK